VPNSAKRELKEVSVAVLGPSVWASLVGAGAAATEVATAVGGGADSVLVALGVLALGVGAEVEAPATGAAITGAGAESAEEEAFFAIVVLYTLIGEVFLSIFRRYIL
jgi:hypothetical protein